MKTSSETTSEQSSKLCILKTKHRRQQKVRRPIFPNFNWQRKETRDLQERK